MSVRHGIYVSEQATGVGTPLVAPSGVPFVVGASPVQAAASPAAAGRPVLCASWEEFVAAFGYSDDWSKYTLCEFAWSHYRLYGCQPVIFVNVLDPATMTAAHAASEYNVKNHRISLPINAINDANLVVTTTGESPSTLVRDTDFTAFYSGEFLVVELLSTSTYYSAAKLSAAFNNVDRTRINSTNIAAALEKVDLCMSTVGAVPDLICAPGFSGDSAIAALMATKAEGINGLFHAKALVDIDCSADGCTAYSGVAAAKEAANLTDPDQIVCWPKVSLGGKIFHMSTHLAGLMAQVDAGNECPYESPSNKAFRMDALVLADGTEVLQTKAQADTVVEAGVVTALNFLASGWVCWGSYTAGYPAATDVKDYLIPVSRMFDWVGNTMIRTFWSRLDLPMTRRMVDTILDTANIWLNGLTGSGYVLGARIEMREEENPLTDLMAGRLRLHISMTPPSPAQEIDFVLEYDAEYVTQAFS